MSARCGAPAPMPSSRCAAGNGEGGAGIAHLQYRPAAHAAPRARRDVALIGKGILFDTGGVNLKTHRSMLDMHTDMSGSAVALATLVALAELRAPLAADAWLAITENRIGPRAYKPAGSGARRQRRHHPGDPHRCGGAHGARRHAGARRPHASRAS